MSPEEFLRNYGFPALPMMTLHLDAPADKAIDPVVIRYSRIANEDAKDAVVEEVRNVRE